MADSARRAALRVLDEVLNRGRSLATALPEQLAALPPKERALAQELSYGTLRWLPRLEALLDLLLQKPLKAKDRDIRYLILIGLYQLAYLSIPPHAAVSETVAITGRLGKSWARGLVNAVLRRFQRERQALEASLEDDPVSRFAHPLWFVQALQRAWPDDWQAILEANNARPPMTLRVNRLRFDRDSYLQQLSDAGIAASASAHAADAITLAEPVAVERLPGFADGHVSVQDAAAQLAARLVAPRDGENILDACAAPGGKTGHLLEQAPGCTVTALDVDAQRLERVRENLTRLGLEARLVAGDGGKPDTWWDAVPFQRILLDAPCSATGVIRRHPDIKTLRRREDIPALVEQQHRLLEAVWPLLDSGGMLVYATCSVLPEENAGQVADFLARHSDARELPIEATWGRGVTVGRQILPGQDGMDGFYYARLIKQ